MIDDRNAPVALRAVWRTAKASAAVIVYPVMQLEIK